MIPGHPSVLLCCWAYVANTYHEAQRVVIHRRVTLSQLRCVCPCQISNSKQVAAAVDATVVACIRTRPRRLKLLSVVLLHARADLYGRHCLKIDMWSGDCTLPAFRLRCHGAQEPLFHAFNAPTCDSTLCLTVLGARVVNGETISRV